MTTEKTIEAKLRLGIESLGGLCIKIPATFFAGIPDRLCLLPGGRAFFVETKATGLKPRPRQEYVKKQLEALGFTVYVVNSLEGVTALLDVYRSPKVSWVAADAVEFPEPIGRPVPRKKGLTPDEWLELHELKMARCKIKDFDPTDDLNREDLKRLLALERKHRGI